MFRTESRLSVSMLSTNSSISETPSLSREILSLGSISLTLAASSLIGFEKLLLIMSIPPIANNSETSVTSISIFCICIACA